MNNALGEFLRVYGMEFIFITGKLAFIGCTLFSQRWGAELMTKDENYDSLSR
jgi:hypothetical protein